MGKVLVKDSLTWIVLQAVYKIWEPGEWTTKVDAMVGEQVKVKKQLPIIVGTVNGNGHGRGLLAVGSPPLRRNYQVSKQDTSCGSERELNCVNSLSLRGRGWASDFKYQVLPYPCTFLKEAKLPLKHWNLSPWLISREGTWSRSHNGTSPCSFSHEVLLRVRIFMRNGMEYGYPWQKVPNLFQQELLLENPTRYIEWGIIRYVLLVQTPQSMLVDKEECGIQAQPRSDQDRLVSASFLTWQRVPHSLGQVPSHLSHHSGQSPSDTPETWANGQPGWVAYHEGQLRHLVIFLFSPVGDTLMTQDKAPWFPRQRSPWSSWAMVEVIQAPWLS